MKPIPRGLLIHNAVLVAAGPPDKWGESQLIQHELKYIRIEPSSRIIQSKDNRQLQLSSTLFYDCLNSRPSGIAFKEGQTVLFMDKEYAVQTVELLFDRNKAHHYEVGLI